MGGIVVVLLLSVGLVSGAPSSPSGPELAGTFLPDGTLVLLWTPDAYNSIGATYEILDSGALLYGSILKISTANPALFAKSLRVTIEQYTPGSTVEPVPVQVGNRTVLVNETVSLRLTPQWSNASVSMPARGSPTVDLPLPGTGGRLLSVAVTMENQTFGFLHLTPDFLIPIPQTTGGIELLAVGEAAWTIFLAAGATGLAKATMRIRGMGAPRSPPVWGAAGLVTGAVAWYGADPVSFLQTVGGTSPLVFPAGIAFFFYFWALRHFDRSELIEVEQPHFTVPLTFTKLYLRLTSDALNNAYASVRTFRGWLFALLGHPTIVDFGSSPELGGRQPYAADVRVLGLANPKDRKSAQKAVRTLKQLGVVPPPEVRRRASGWVVRVDDATAPVRKFKVDSDQKISYRPGRFRWTRSEQTLAGADGVAPSTRRHFSPHIEDARWSVPATGGALVDEEAAAVDGAKIEALARSLELTKLQVLAADRKVHDESDRKTEERVRVLTSILERSTSVLNEEDAAKEVRELRTRSRASQREGNKQPTSEERSEVTG